MVVSPRNLWFVFSFLGTGWLLGLHYILATKVWIFWPLDFISLTERKIILKSSWNDFHHLFFDNSLFMVGQQAGNGNSLSMVLRTDHCNGNALPDSQNELFLSVFFLNNYFRSIQWVFFPEHPYYALRIGLHHALVNLGSFFWVFLFRLSQLIFNKTTFPWFIFPVLGWMLIVFFQFVFFLYCFKQSI